MHIRVGSNEVMVFLYRSRHAEDTLEEGYKVPVC